MSYSMSGSRMRVRFDEGSVRMYLGDRCEFFAPNSASDGHVACTAAAPVVCMTDLLVEMGSKALYMTL